MARKARTSIWDLWAGCAKALQAVMAKAKLPRHKWVADELMHAKKKPFIFS